MMIRVPFDKYERAICDHVGELRNECAVEAGREDSTGLTTDQAGKHRTGTRAEFIASKHLGLYWDWCIGRRNKFDVGPFEVKGCRRAPSDQFCCMCLRKGFVKPNAPHIFVSVPDAGDFAFIVGWSHTVSQWLDADHWKKVSPRPPSWFVHWREMLDPAGLLSSWEYKEYVLNLALQQSEEKSNGIRKRDLSDSGADLRDPRRGASSIA